jgi:FkbM family methyltransferase
MTDKAEIVVVGGDPPSVQPRLWHGWGGDVAFDIGANCGQSLPHLVECGFMRIFAFEPNPLSYEFAKTAAAEFNSGAPETWGRGLREIGKDGTRAVIDVMRVAVSDHTGTVRLAQLGGVQQATGQLVTPGIMGMEWEPQGGWGDDNEDIEYEMVSCATIDVLSDALGDPDFIKVDTEGHEKAIVKGATETLRTCAPAWLIEFHSPGNMTFCRDLLLQFGYRVDVVRHPHYPPGSRMWSQHGWLRAEKKNRLEQAGGSGRPREGNTAMDGYPGGTEEVQTGPEETEAAEATGQPDEVETGPADAPSTPPDAGDEAGEE